MPYIITEPCIGTQDKSCVEVCPVNCIYGDADDRMCYVHPVDCIDCGVCEAACPVQAIYPASEVRGEAVPFVVINALWFQDKVAARAAVAGLSR